MRVSDLTKELTKLNQDYEIDNDTFYCLQQRKELLSADNVLRDRLAHIEHFTR